MRERFKWSYERFSAWLSLLITAGLILTTRLWILLVILVPFQLLALWGAYRTRDAPVREPEPGGREGGSDR